MSDPKNTEEQPAPGEPVTHEEAVQRIDNPPPPEPAQGEADKMKEEVVSGGEEAPIDETVREGETAAQRDKRVADERARRQRTMTPNQGPNYQTR